MIITWEDLKKASYNRMALESDEYSDYTESVVEGVNHCMLELAKLFPIRGQYELTQSETEDEGENEYDMKTLCESFMEFSHPPVLKGNYLVSETEYTIIGNRYLRLKKSNSGTFKVQYNKYPTKITAQTENSFILELSPEAVNLIPLYVTWWAYQDDDASKATMAYNEFSEAKQGLINPPNFKGGITIEGGIDI